MMTTNSLYDATIRQQLYIEGIKNHHKDEFLKSEDIIVSIIISMLASRGVTNLGELTRTQFNKFISDLDKKLKRILKKENNRIYAIIKDLLITSFGVSREIYTTIVGVGPKIGRANTLWKKFQNDIVPGPGMTSGQMLGSFMGSAINDIKRLITTSWADKLTANELMARLIGTRDLNFRDGLMRKLANNFNTLLFTLMQKAVNNVDYYMGRLFFDKYEWVSVLDNRTTPICRGRDGNIYVYGEGPVPPAHYNCRSRTVPVAMPKATVKPAGPIAPIPRDETAAQWLARQPRTVRDDLVGKRSGEANDTINRRANPLTIEEYRNKVNRILT